MLRLETRMILWALLTIVLIEYSRWMAQQPANYVVQLTNDTDELESSTDKMNPFSDMTIRKDFIRKVFFILTFQLMITLALICLFVFCIPIKTWVLLNPWFTYTLFPALFGLIITLACFEDARRKVPENFFLLFIFTLVEGLLLGAVSVFYHAEEVMWAIGGTALVTWGLTLFALQTKFDFTNHFAILWALSFVLVLYGALSFFMPSYWLHLIYAALGTLLFSGYLVLDTQLMLGGSHQYALSPEEYVFATLNLYLDIINIFIFILQLISSERYPP
ncbi:protein lifeguard 2-like [Trichosurus vulpecula]|uniref:protein lifeguard 2-like n=1 Tax=Trichosurus vulpecula TaxID=9337 RepID=UPI00186B489F|nr:protein lifeguard 2-like [Trichosurus vulpecula]